MIVKLLTHLFLALFAVFAQQSHETTSCPYPVPPKHAVLSARSYLDEFNFHGFQAYQRVDFICRVGYRHTKGDMWSICGVSGRWYPDTREAGECARELRTGKIECKGRFSCRKDLQCIDRKLLCDCKADCRDGTDEVGCEDPKKIIVISPVGRKKSGVLTSPNYPLGYARKDFRCHFIFYSDIAYRIKLSFEDFSLRERSRGRCMDYVKVIGVDDVYTKKFENKAMGSSLKKDKKSSVVSCGNTKFGTVISNNSQLEMVVRLTGVKVSARTPQLKGYSLSWSAVPESKAVEIVGKVSKSLQPVKTKSVIKSKPKGKSTGENLFTILLPVTISALLPVSMLLFLCYHIRAKHTDAAREEQAKKSEDTRQGQQQIGVSDSNSIAVIKGDVNDDPDLALMLLKEKIVDGSDGDSAHEENETLMMTNRPLETAHSQAYQKLNATYTSPSQEFDSMVMTVDLDFREKCSRFLKTSVISDEAFRKPTHLSTARALDNACHDRRTSSGVHEARSSDRISSIDRDKYLENRQWPQSKVVDDDTAQTANRNCCVCSCNDCENKRSKIERFVPLACTFDTVEEICTEGEGSRPQNLDGDGGYDRLTARHSPGGYESVTNGRHGPLRQDGRERRGKRRRKHGRRSRTMERCPGKLRPCELRKQAALPESYYENCSICSSSVAQARGTLRDAVDGGELTRLATVGHGSNRSNSSDSGTYTGSEAPSKWHSQGSYYSIQNGFRYRSDTDSISRESAYAESFDDCARFCSCQQCHARRNVHHGHRQRYSGYAPSQGYYGYYRNQDGRSIMADGGYDDVDRMGQFQGDCPERNNDLQIDPNRKYCDYMGTYSITDGPIVFAETEGNFGKLPIQSNHLRSEEVFQNGRHSKESVVYADNGVNIALLESTPSYAAVCHCDACDYSRLNGSFVSVNRPLNAIAPASAVLPWQQAHCSSDLGIKSETDHDNLTLIR